MAPTWPEACPYFAPGDAGCALRHLRDRPRKTGPRHPLAVVHCGTHQRAFTLYPPGFGPYLRDPVARLSPEGAEVSAPAGSDLEGTLFEAALDAAEGRAWTRSAPERKPGRWWSSQGRLLCRALDLLGLDVSLADALRDDIAQVLGVGGLLLREQAARASDGGYRARGAAILAVLRAIGRTATKALRLFTSGHLIGRWGRPLHWDHRRRHFDRVPFRLPGVAPPS